MVSAIITLRSSFPHYRRQGWKTPKGLVDFVYTSIHFGYTLSIQVTATAFIATAFIRYIANHWIQWNPITYSM